MKPLYAMFLLVWIVGCSDKQPDRIAELEAKVKILEIQAESRRDRDLGLEFVESQNSHHAFVRKMVIAPVESALNRELPFGFYEAHKDLVGDYSQAINNSDVGDARLREYWTKRRKELGWKVVEALNNF